MNGLAVHQLVYCSAICRRYLCAHNGEKHDRNMCGGCG